MSTLVNLSIDLNCSIEYLLSKPYEWLLIVNIENEKRKLKDRIQLAKLIGIANRLKENDLTNMENLFDWNVFEHSKHFEQSKQLKTNFDIRELERIPGMKIIINDKEYKRKK